MSIAILFFGALAAVAAWWLAQQGLTTKPWLEEGVIGEVRGVGASPPPSKIGLTVFLAVVGSLFSLFILAYSMRRGMGDWKSLPLPTLLWLNTAVLILSSAALHRAQVAARRGEVDGVRAGLHAGGVSALVFLAGQLLAWKQLTAAGYFLATNPANSFFYLLTAAHGLHVLGGMVALGRTVAKVWLGFGMEQLRLSVELCAMYWHFLLLVWLVLFGLLLHA